MRYFLRRLLLAVPVAWGVATIVFFFVHLLPGDPEQILLGERAAPAAAGKIRAEYHLDEPVVVQYGYFLAGLARADLKHSIAYGRPVSELIWERWPATAKLAFLAVFFSLLFALPLGTLAAVRAGGPLDHAAMTLSLLGISMPSFWLGPLLIVIFSVHFNLFPVSGAEEARSIVLPALTLGAAMAALLSRMVRAQLLETLSRDYLRTARAKGLSPWAVVVKHALRNALVPVLTIVGVQFGVLLSGAIITEKVFAWPGLGSLLLEGIFQRDYPVVQGCVLAISLVYVAVNLVTDFLYGVLDPRIRVGGEGA